MTDRLENAPKQTMLYRVPQVMSIDVKAQGVLCASPYGENTEKFTLGSNSYDESDWD